MTTRAVSPLRVAQKAALTSLYGANCIYTTNVTHVHYYWESNALIIIIHGIKYITLYGSMAGDINKQLLFSAHDKVC